MDTKADRKDAETWPNPRGQTPHPGSEPARASPGLVPVDYRFAGFTLDTRRQLLIRGAAEMRLRPRTYDVLAYLVRHPGRLVGKPELMDAVWGRRRGHRRLVGPVLHGDPSSARRGTRR